MSVTRSYKTVTFSKYESAVLFNILLDRRIKLENMECNNPVVGASIADEIEVINAALDRLAVA